MPNELYKILRSHQKKAADAISSGVRKGQVLLPTGVGKTYVQIHKILDTIQKKKGTPIVSVIAAHRLLLCEQLILELVNTVSSRKGIDFNVLTVASEGVDLQDLAVLMSKRNPLGNVASRCTVKQCTSGKDIRDFAEQTRKLGRHLLIVSTYHSFDRMVGLPIDVACMDEAHTITEPHLYNNVQSIMPSINEVFFFTATQVTGLNGRGMNNKKFYGQVLCKVPPRDAIDTHDILPPITHSINLKNGKVTDRNIIQAAYKAHREEVLRVSKMKLAPKMLVSVAGVDDMVALLTDNDFHKWALQSGINVIGFSSSQGYYQNGLEVSRKEALQAIKNLKDDDSAIIMHYDILTEGIDLPTITAVMPLRELNKVKFLQTLGRAARLQSDDRKKIYENQIVGTSVDGKGLVVADNNMVKPYYWVIISPKLNEKAVDTGQGLIDIIRNSYNLGPEERNVKPTSTTSTVADAESVLPKEVLLPKERTVTEYQHTFEALVFLGMEPADQKSMIAKTLKEIPHGSQNQIPQSQTVPPLPPNPPAVPQASTPRYGREKYDSFLGI